MNILIIKLGAIGDVLRTTAILPGLKDKYENCRISWVTKRESFDILKNDNFIDSIFLMDDNLKEKLNDENFDLIISLDDEPEACKLASSLEAKRIVGAYLKDNKRVYTEDSELWFDIGLISRFGRKKADELKALNKKTYQEILFGILKIENKNYEPQLILDKKSIEFARYFSKKNDIGKNLAIGINTGAGGRWQDKKLSIEDTAGLIDKLNNELKNAKLLLFGGPEEKERNKKIKDNIKTKIIDAGCDNSLMEFASLVNLCDVLVTSDSLAMHIGIALKKKVVCFFAPTSPQEIELYNRGIKILPKKGCVCCYKPKCDIAPEWDIDEFVESVKRLLK